MLTFFIKRPRFAMVIALVITLLGAIALRIIPVEQYPQITPPVVNVSASWPGASSADVAEAIATPLETQLNGVDHMLYMESTSSDEGSYSLNITFAAGTDPDLTEQHPHAAVRQQLRQHPGARGAVASAGRRAGTDVWRTGLQHAHLAEAGPHERPERDQR